MAIRLKPMFTAIVGATVVAVALLLTHVAYADKHPLGNHPAVIVYKNWNRLAYTERTVIYPHPAEIWWYTYDPNTTNHPHHKKSVN
ncbi:MAG TPA: hypothetical protein VLV32_03730 [Burkholderiales bacterium]|nr:hypothetical protein [Burkholderiales bacterium]